MQLTHALHKGVLEHPDAVALIHGSRCMTWSDLYSTAATIAGALTRLGVQEGDRVAVLASNSEMYVACLYGIWWAGAVANPVNSRWTAAEISYSLNDCETKILFFEPSFATIVAEAVTAAPSVKSTISLGEPVAAASNTLSDLLTIGDAAIDASRSNNDLAIIMYTGGTTGRSKGVMLTHGSLYLSALSSLSVLPTMSSFTGVVVGPLFHVGGLGHLLMLMHRQATVVMLPGFQEDALLAAIDRHGIQEVNLVPTMIKRLLDHPRLDEFDISSLTTICYGAAPIDATLQERVLSRIPGSSLFQFYGMTELSPAITCLRAWDHRDSSNMQRLRSAGRPLPIAEVAIHKDDGGSAACGEVGEIVARGPMLMKGYYNLPLLTAETLRGGWMHTGDLGFIDADGYLYVVDRLKDMIVTGGENVYSTEVETVIAGMPEVSMVAVVGASDPEWGERVHAVVTLHEPGRLSAADVIAHCRRHIAGYKCPRSVEFRETLPLSAAGKILKQDLRHDIGPK